MQFKLSGFLEFMNKIRILQCPVAVIFIAIIICFISNIGGVFAENSINPEHPENQGYTPNVSQTITTTPDPQTKQEIQTNQTIQKNQSFQNKQSPQLSQESILNYNSYIKIHEDSLIEVTETITVKSTGQNIKHGIYRDFPTVYRDEKGKLTVPFNVLDVRLGKFPVDHFQQHLMNGIRLYLGNKHMNLIPGVYTYTIHYTTAKQIGFFPDFDDLYWNVTGNAWIFPIDSVYAEVELPPGAKVLQSTAYTGLQGARGQDFKSFFKENGNIVFQTTRVLAPYEGLTIAVSWPKGFVDASKLKLSDNEGHHAANLLNVKVAAICFAIVVLYFILIQYFTHTKLGVVIPLYQPPADLSPAEISYLANRGYRGVKGRIDYSALSGALINLAVKGKIKIIHKDADSDYTIKKLTDNLDGLSEDEKILMSLFKTTEDLDLSSLKKQRETALAFNKGINDFYLKLHENCSKYLFSHRVAKVFAWIIVMIALSVIAPFLTWNTFWLSVSLGVILGLILNIIQNPLSYANYMVIIFIAIFTVVLLGGPGIFSDIDKSDLIVMLFTALILTMALSQKFKGYTKFGIKTMTDIEGFKLFLSVTEKDRYRLLQSPEVTPEIFEKYLPYAIALGVEEEWQHAFAKDFFQPEWYEGRQGYQVRPFNQQLAALSTAITAAAITSTTAGSRPGSSSGFGGGGFSGGGGGGGGGGGW